MATFIMLTRLGPAATRSPESLDRLERLVMGHVRRQCPGVEWVASYATLGPYDYVDVFHADDVSIAMQVSLVFRMHGHTHTEVWPAADWPQFKDLIRSVSAAQAG